jgi:predicted small metal-binding protein
MTDITYLADADHNTLETALEQLIETAQVPNDDPTGTYTVPARNADRPAYTVEITTKPTTDESQATANRVSYCCECGWRVTTADYSSQEVSSRAVKHAVETGHDIESDRQDRPATESTPRPLSGNHLPSIHNGQAERSSDPTAQQSRDGSTELGL